MNVDIQSNLISLSEEKKILTNILIYFDEICKANDIHYSLCGGTLLGAVRNGEFIPWDDDIDVFLIRKEFDKLIPSLFKNTRFMFKESRDDPQYDFPFARLEDTNTYIYDAVNLKEIGHGISIHISCVDGLPDNIFLRYFHIYRMIFIRKMYGTAHYELNKEKIKKLRGVVVNTYKRIVCKFSTIKYWNDKLVNSMSRFPVENGKYIANLTSSYGIREVLKKEVFDSYSTIEFEKRNFEICAGYEEYLKAIYGDNYLELPPIEDRISKHETSACWRKK